MLRKLPNGHSMPLPTRRPLPVRNPKARGTSRRKKLTSRFQPPWAARKSITSIKLLFRTGEESGGVGRDGLFNRVPHGLGSLVPVPFETGSVGLLARLCVEFFVGEQTMDAISQTCEISSWRFQPPARIITPQRRQIERHAGQRAAQRLCRSHAADIKHRRIYHNTGGFDDLVFLHAIAETEELHVFCNAEFFRLGPTSRVERARA